MVYMCPFLSNLLLAAIMLKHRKDDTPKDGAQTSAKQAHNPTTEFQVAHPQEAQSTSRLMTSPSTAASSCTTSTISHITTLAIGSSGRLKGRQKDRSHPTTELSPSTLPPTQADAPSPNIAPRTPDFPEDTFQATSADIETDYKPKQKQDNKTWVSNSTSFINFPTNLCYFEVKTTQMALAQG